MSLLNTLKFLFATVFLSPVSLHAEDTLFLPQHNFYLSISEIVYKQDIQTFEISIRLFSDDFEKTILNYSGTQIFDADGNALTSVNSKIFSYFKKHFVIYDEKGKEIEYAFLGWETEKEVSWCYLEAHHRKFKYLSIKNNLMTEMFRSQKNLVYLKFNQRETSIMLDKEKTYGFLKFE